MNRTEKAAWLAKLAAEDTSTAAERAEFEQAERERLARSFAVRSARERLRVLRDNAEAYRSRGEPIEAMIAQAVAELAAAGTTPKGTE